jgi:hypothetical protein
MASLHETQRNFLHYLLDNSEHSILSQIVSTTGHSAQQRMTFYGNAYRARLKEALETDFEQLHTYLGDNLFDQLVQHYIDHYPSTHPNLRYFSQHMIDLVSTLHPFNQWPEVIEITRIEQAFNYSFDSPDANLITLQHLQQLDTEAWTRFKISFHDSVQLLTQHYNSFQIWQALTEQHTPPEKQRDKSSWLIWRKDLVSRYRSLPEPELAAFKIALSGGSFVDICEVLMTFYGDEDTPQYALHYLQQWINDQMICGLEY